MSERLSDRIRVAARVQPHRERHRQIDQLCDGVRAFEAEAADREKYNSDGWEEADLARADAESKAEAFEGELLRARATNQRLNRRCQLAESGLAEQIEKVKRSGGSLGRALANAAATMYKRERDDLLAAAGEVLRIDRDYGLRIEHEMQVALDLLRDVHARIGAGADSTTSGTSRAPGSSESAPPAPTTSEGDR